MLVRLLGNLLGNPINIPLRRFAFAARHCPPSKGNSGINLSATSPQFPLSKGVPERQRGWGMLVRLLGNLFVNRMNIPLRRFAFAARRCPPSKGNSGINALPDYKVNEH